MNMLVKNLGVIILLIGVAILGVAFFTSSMSNAVLIIGIVVMIAGYVCHIFLNKKE